MNAFFQKPNKLNSKQEKEFRDKVYDQLEYIAKSFSERSRLIFKTIRNSIDHSLVTINGDKIYFNDYTNPLTCDDKKMCSTSIDELLLQMYELNILRTTYLDYREQYGVHSQPLPIVPYTIINLLKDINLIGASTEVERNAKLLRDYFIGVKDYLDLYDSKSKDEEVEEIVSSQIKK